MCIIKLLKKKKKYFFIEKQVQNTKQKNNKKKFVYIDNDKKNSPVKKEINFKNEFIKNEEIKVIKSHEKEDDLIKNINKKQINTKIKKLLKNISDKKEEFSKEEKKEEIRNNLKEKKESNNSLKNIYIKYLNESLKEDKKEIKKINDFLIEIKEKQKEVEKENDIDKQKQLLTELLTLIEEMKDKYYYLFLNDNKENYSFNKINIIELINKKDNESLKKGILEIKEAIKYLENNCNYLLEVNKDKKEDKISKKKKIISINEKQDSFNKICLFTSDMISYQNDLYKRIQKDLGKITLKKYTKSKLSINYDKLLTSTLLLGLVPPMMEKRKKYGLLIGTALMTGGITSLFNFITYKDEEHQKAIIKDYNSLLNINLNNVDYSIKSINISLSDLDILKKDFINKYDYSIQGYNITLKKFDLIRKDLINKQKELIKIKDKLEISKKENQKALIRKKKIEY